MKKIKITIGELFKKLNITSVDEIEHIKGLNIKTPSGELAPILGFIKKSPKEIYKYSFDNGSSIKCSDEHLFQENGVTTKAKDCKVVDTINKQIKVIKSEFINKDFVYDISIDEPHLYVTPNGIIHHNTSLVNAIIKDLDADVKWLNGSQDRGIDTFKVSVKEFVTSVSIDDSPKIVVIDEADGLTKDAQKILRGLIEEFSKNSTFILTCNYKEQLIEPLRNRFTHFDFDNIYNQNKKEIGLQIFQRLQFILNNENIKYDKASLTPVVSNMYPSVRKMVLVIQQSIDDGVLNLNESMINLNTRFSEILELIRDKKFVDVRKKLQDLDDPASLYTFIFKNLDEWFVPQSQPQVVLLCARYQDMNSNARDKAICSAAFAVEIMGSPGIEFL